jgi:hypothetical protein
VALQTGRDRGDFHLRLGNPCLLDIVPIARDGDGGERTDDDHRDHNFKKRETLVPGSDHQSGGRTALAANGGRDK